MWLEDGQSRGAIDHYLRCVFCEPVRCVCEESRVCEVCRGMCGRMVAARPSSARACIFRLGVTHRDTSLRNFPPDCFYEQIL